MISGLATSQVDKRGMILMQTVYQHVKHANSESVWGTCL